MKNKILQIYHELFWIFIIGSFFGFVYENILMLVKGHYALRQGLIYEPLIPIYGIGLIMFYLLFKNITLKDQNLIVKVLKIFLISFLAGGLTEYLGSYIQERCFGTISWDYSYMRFDLNGRTSLFHSSIWGLLGTLFYFLVLPLIKNLNNMKKGRVSIFLTTIFSLFLIFDCTISILACNRHQARQENINPSSILDRYLDKKYPDELIDYIYNNAKVPQHDKLD